METKIFVEGMTCGHCEKKIKMALEKLDSIQLAQANASKNQIIIKHHSVLDDALIDARLKAIGYSVVKKDSYHKIKVAVMLLSLVVLTYVVLRYGNRLKFDFLPNIRQNMDYGALFIVGLLTSVHCMAMCGGINITQCNRYRHLKPSYPSLLYNLGRVTSYTFLGGIIGGLGSVLSFSGQLRGYVTIAVSFVMILMAIKMLKLFQFPFPTFKLPDFLKKPLLKLSSKGPYFVGLANGFMPCGPLQSMQLYALGTGSVIRGALAMFYFSVGTFPLMFGLGFVSSLLEHRFSKHIMKFSGLLIFVLGLAMFSRGAALAGVIIPFQSSGPVTVSTLVANELQEVSIDLQANDYEPIQVRVGIPVNLIINAKAENMNGCNNPIAIPSLGIEQTLYPGENVITFTPTEKGKMAYTCWMGMITSYIDVVE
jgi:sulfite exporter TauE/SafE/copper chaperone CopZ